MYVEAGAGGVAFPTFHNCTFQNNESGSGGGAVYHSEAPSVVAIPMDHVARLI